MSSKNLEVGVRALGLVCFLGSLVFVNLPKKENHLSKFPCSIIEYNVAHFHIIHTNMYVHTSLQKMALF